MRPTIAFVAEGKLYLTRPGQAATLIESPFVQELHDRTARTRERNEWKQGSMGWNATSANRMGFGPGLGAEVRRVRFSGVTGANNSDLIYTLDTDTVGGLFEYTTADGYERRLYHRNQFRAGDVHRHPVSGKLVLSLAADAGTVQLGLTEPDGRKLRSITEGDAIDQAPTWAGGEGEIIVYQSAGIGRNAAGIYTERSTFALFELDLSTGEGGPILEDDQHDLLAPRRLADGTLYFIRRPYVAVPPRSPWRILRDILMFPIGFFLTIVHLLNFLSVLVRQKPLLTSGGPPGPGQDPKYLLLYGEVIRADKQLKQANAAVPLVPKDYELVCRTPDGKETTLARSVAAFDVLPDGGLVYTDGSTVWHRTPAGEVSALTTGRLIERVTVVA